MHCFNLGHNLGHVERSEVFLKPIRHSTFAGVHIASTESALKGDNQLSAMMQRAC